MRRGRSNPATEVSGRWLACDWSVSQREGSSRSSSAVPPPVQLIGLPPRSPSGLEAAEPHMNEAMAASSHRIMLGPLVAAIDQGTSSTRFLVRRTRRRKPSSRPAASYLAVMLSLPMPAVPLAFHLHHKASLLKRWVSEHGLVTSRFFFACCPFSTKAATVDDSIDATFTCTVRLRRWAMGDRRLGE